MHEQISLFPRSKFLADFTPDCWETPSLVAQKMAALITKSDRRVIKPAAGTGQIAQYLPTGSFCCEIKPNRLQHLKLNTVQLVMNDGFGGVVSLTPGLLFLLLLRTVTGYFP